MKYNFDIDSEEDVNKKTEDLIQFWYQRWLLTRLTTVDIDARLRDYNIERQLLGNRI